MYDYNYVHDYNVHVRAHVSPPPPGTVAVTPGDAFVTSTEDLAPFLRRGDVIKIGDDIVTVAPSGGVLSHTRVPLSSAYGGPGGPALPGTCSDYAHRAHSHCAVGLLVVGCGVIHKNLYLHFGDSLKPCCVDTAHVFLMAVDTF